MKYSCIRCATDTLRPICDGCESESAVKAGIVRSKEEDYALGQFMVPGGLEGLDWPYTLGGNAIVKNKSHALRCVQLLVKRCVTSVRPGIKEWWLDADQHPLARWASAQGLATAIREGDTWADSTYMLVVTDLGKEHVSEYWCAKLQDLLRDRTIKNRPTIIHTDAQPSEFRSRYGPWAEGIIGELKGFQKP